MKKTLLISLCALLIFACKKDDDKTPDQTQGGGNPITKTKCKTQKNVTYDSAGMVTAEFTYYYTGDKLDSIIPNHDDYAKYCTYTDELNRKIEYYYNGTNTGVYDLEVLNEYGNIVQQETYTNGDNLATARTLEYNCGRHNTKLNNEYCFLTKLDFYNANTNSTTTINYYYTGTRLDSIVGTAKVVYEYLTANERKAIDIINGDTAKSYRIETINEYGGIVKVRQFSSWGNQISRNEFVLKCN